MFNNLKDRFNKFRKFVGNDVWGMLLKAVSLGTMWFFVESFFLFVLQGMLFSLGLINEQSVYFYNYLPKSPLGSALMLVSYSIMRGTVGGLRDYYLGVINQAFNRVQREKIINYSLNYANQLTSYDVMGIFTDTVMRSSAVIKHLTQLINSVTTGFLLFCLALRMAPLELTIAICLLAFFMLIIEKLLRKRAINGSDVAHSWSDVMRTFHLGFKNFFLINLYQFVGQEVKRGSDALRLYEHTFKKHYRYLSLKTQAPTFAGVCVLSIVLYISRKYIGTSGTVLISFFYVFIRIAQAGSEANVAIAELKVFWPSFISLYEWELNFSKKVKNQKIVEINNEVELINGQIKLNVQNVDFGYEDSKLIFNKLTLTVRTGDFLLIKGESGAGKSTLLSILMGIQAPIRGEVTINDHAISGVRVSLAKLVGYVGSEPYLIPGTIQENLTYGLTGAVTESELKEALLKACVLDEVMNLPRKLNEHLLESVQLSTGQKQRISIARAYLRKPKLLIWDEATSNLDESIERKCIENLLNSRNEMAMIVVSHKNSFDSFATQLLELRS